MEGGGTISGNRCPAANAPSVFAKHLKRLADLQSALEPFFEEALAGGGDPDDRILNKRAYNYLKVTLRLALRNRLRRIYRRKSRDGRLASAAARLGPSASWAQSPESMAEEPFAGAFAGVERELALLLSQGYSRKEARKRLGLTEKGLENAIASIKAVLEEEMAC